MDIALAVLSALITLLVLFVPRKETEKERALRTGCPDEELARRKIMPKLEITQEQIDAGINELRDEWDRKFAESGEEMVCMFVMGSKWAVQALAQYQEIKEGVEAEGFTCPVLVEGIEVSSPEDEHDG